MARRNVDMLPGATSVPGRKFLYLEPLGTETFNEMFRNIQDFVRTQANAGRKPNSGALLSEDVEVMMPNGYRFFGFSFRGDVKRWAELLIEFAKERGVQICEVSENYLELSDGQRIELKECTFQMLDIEVGNGEDGKNNEKGSRPNP